MYNIIHLSEALRIFIRSIKVKIKGVNKYQGNAEQICKKIVDDCFNGKYFQVSNGHFCEFYMRDFGWCVDSLVALGYRKKVLKTLDYVLFIYSKEKLTTTITPKGKCVDIFDYSVDTLPFLIRSLRVCEGYDIIKKYKKFLEKEIKKCFDLCFDKKTSMVTQDRHFSSMKDEALRFSSTYDNCMIAMLSKDLDFLGLFNPFSKYDIKSRIKEELWNGEYFYDDMKKEKVVMGDSNVIPFWTGIFDVDDSEQNKDMLIKSIRSIKDNGLDYPFPLKYNSDNYSAKTKLKFNIVSKLVCGYEKNSIWMHMGPLYIDIVSKVDKKLALNYLNSYKKVIEKNHNFLEIFDFKGNPFKSPFYYSDEGMLWAVNYLYLDKKIRL